MGLAKEAKSPGNVRRSESRRNRISNREGESEISKWPLLNPSHRRRKTKAETVR